MTSRPIIYERRSSHIFRRLFTSKTKGTLASHAHIIAASAPPAEITFSRCTLIASSNHSTSRKYNATQGSIPKVLRKQWSYARGQAYVLFEHRAHAVKATTQNRNVRAIHRMSQVASSVFEILCLALMIVSSRFALLLAVFLLL